MTTNAPANTIGQVIYQCPPKEGYESITIDLRFDQDAQQDVDFSDIQNKGKWTGLATIFIDNSLSASAISAFIPTTRQTFKIPPNGYAYIPVICPANPPAINFNSAGGIIITALFLNFFIPPVIWSPTAAPGGGSSGGGGVVKGALTDASGVTPLVIAANPARQYLIIENLPGSGTNLLLSFGGGANIELLPGAAYSTDVFVSTDAVTVTTAAPGVAFTAYEG